MGVGCYFNNGGVSKEPGRLTFLTFNASPTDVEVFIVIISLGLGGALRETLPLWSSWIRSRSFRDLRNAFVASNDGLGLDIVT